MVDNVKKKEMLKKNGYWAGEKTKATPYLNIMLLVEQRKLFGSLR